jgi:hypothetical protein
VSERTILLPPFDQPIQPPSRSCQTSASPIDLRLGVEEEIVVLFELGADLEREVVLAIDGGREEGEAGVLVCM